MLHRFRRALVRLNLDRLQQALVTEPVTYDSVVKPLPKPAKLDGHPVT